MLKKHRDFFHSNPLLQEHPEDTLQYAVAVLHCLQHLDLKNGLSDEGELGFNLIVETVRFALRSEAHKLLSVAPSQE